MLLADLFEADESIDWELVEAAKGHFGLTRSPNEVGYLMPDGSMLDLSGRHYAGDYERDPSGSFRPVKDDYLAGNRYVDHRELDSLVGQDGTDAMYEFMDRTHAVRVMPDVGFSLRKAPTPRQIAVMVALSRAWNDQVYVDYHEDSLEISPPVNAAKMVGTLKKLKLI